MQPQAQIDRFFRFASFFLHLRSILREICLILDLYLPVQTSRLLLFRFFKAYFPLKVSAVSFLRFVSCYPDFR